VLWSGAVIEHEYLASDLCVAVCYSVSHRVAVCYSVSQCVAVCYSVSQCVVVFGSVV